MDIKQLARSLGVTQQPTLNRAIELLRLLKLKIPGGLGQGEICRPAVCLELACQTTPGSKLPARDEFVRCSCSAPKVYKEMFTRIQRLLDVRPALDLRELVTLFGCAQLHDNALQLLRTYKSRFLESIATADRARADLSRPAFLAASFILTAKKHRAQVDRAALTAKMGLTRAELAAAIEDITTRCSDQLVPAGSGKRERDEGDEGVQGEGGEKPGPSGGVGVGGGTTARAGAKRGRREEDEEEEDGRPGCAADVAVEDLKLILIGLGPTAGVGVAEGPGGCGTGGRERKVRQRVARKKGPARKEDGVEGEDDGPDGHGAAAMLDEGNKGNAEAGGGKVEESEARPSAAGGADGPWRWGPPPELFAEYCRDNPPVIAAAESVKLRRRK